MNFFRKINGRFAFMRISTLALILFLSTSQIYLLSPFLFSDYLNLSDGEALSHLICFNLGVGYILWTFFLVSARHPGRVSRDYTPPRCANTAAGSSSQQDIRARAEIQGSASAVRWCRACRLFRPPRSHHCRKCQTCVLRMDHHCPWLDNCVGYSNHAVFIKFLLAVVIVAAYLCWQSIRCFLWLLELEDQRGPPFSGVDEESNLLIIVVCATVAAASAIICLMVLCLWIYQTWNAFENMTTIEAWSQKRVEELIHRSKIPATAFPYDLHSFRRNLKSMFGPRWYLWWWPPYSAFSTRYFVMPEHSEYDIPEGQEDLYKTGHAFSVNEDHDPMKPWPPVDPTRTVIRSAMRLSGFTYGQDAVTDVAAFEQRRQASNMRQRSTPPTHRARVSAAVNAIMQVEHSISTEPPHEHGNETNEQSGLLSASDSEEDLIEGEALSGYGVDEDVAADQLEDVVAEEGGMTLRQLLDRQRKLFE